MKKRYISLLIILSLVLTTGSFVYASSLNYYNVDVLVLDNGDAIIDMIWEYDESSNATEHYIPLKKKGLEIEDLQVSLNGREYQVIDYWDINGSFEDKAYKAGINETPEDYEICWGISEKGPGKKFNVSYKAKGFVKATSDGKQMINYRLLNDNLSENPEKISFSLSIENKDMDINDIKYWVFGYDGESSLVDGSIKGSTQNEHNPYIHLLIEMPDNYININKDDPLYMADGSFIMYKDLAFEGSEYENVNPDKEAFLEVLSKLMMILTIVIINFTARSRGSLSNKYSIKNNVVDHDYKDMYYRDLPYDKSLSHIFLILKDNFRVSLTNMNQYLILKFILEGKISVESYEERTLISKKEKYGLEIKYSEKFDNAIEEEFYNILLDASGHDHFLEEDEFSRWIKKQKNIDRYTEYEAMVNRYSFNKINKEGYSEENKDGLLSSTITLNEKGRELSANLIKFKNYLKDYSLLSEKTSFNVHIWDKYMLFAAAFGITEAVEKEFEKLNPNYTKDVVLDYNAIRLGRMYSINISNQYSSAIVRASSGLGGTTSTFGGGGGFGGSSGGGSR